MALTPGTKIGVYEATAPIGEGGMGHVWRAKDATLGRQVAIKILPDAFASDPERLARFEREAKTLASLNHPHIAAIYGFEKSGGVHALVMELVEGEDLSQRIARGAIPLDEALPIARQIAEALEAAHEQGIIHRDLKPANIKVRPDGTVKVLDFGLAKAMDSPASSPNVTQSPTITTPAMTQAGMILGTAAYMSPEQAKGRAVDKRSDVWAFGAVVYEMLTGRRAFHADDVSETLAAVLMKEPDWTVLSARAPASVVTALQRCLRKDRKQRVRDIGDVSLALDGAFETAALQAVAPATPHSRARSWVTVAVSVLIGALVAAASAVWLLRVRPSSGGDERSSLRLSIVHPEGGEVGLPVISPDARRVAYPARRADGMPLIWVRELEHSTPKPLAGTEGGDRVFWSPDSKRLGFVVADVLKQISADGGPVQEVARSIRVGASWGTGDVVLYDSGNGQIIRVNASGGPAAAVTTLQGPAWEHVWPSLLPDGRHFLYTAKHWAGLAETGAQGIYLGSIDDSSAARQLLPELSSAVYAPPGFLVFARDGQLMAAPFDAKAGRITGEPTALGEAVAFDATLYTAGVSAAADGTLAIRPPPAPVVSTAGGQSGAFDSQLTLLKRDGSIASRFGGIQNFNSDMAVSPDGRTVVALVQDARTSALDLWRFDVASGARVPLTAMRTSGGYVGSPVWSPDGAQLAFACQPPGILDDVCILDVHTGALTTAIESKAIWEHPVAWSTDGQYLLLDYNDYTGSSLPELRVWSFKTRTPSTFIKDAHVAVFSPDTRFVAFSSRETGRVEVSVTTFPERRQTWPVTTDGGRVLSWSADGKELLIATLTGHIVAYPVSTTGGTFSAGTPQVLLRDVGFDARYARATRDHSRILIRVPKDADKDRGEIRLLFGWAKGLKQ